MVTARDRWFLLVLCTSDTKTHVIDASYKLKEYPGLVFHGANVHRYPHLSYGCSMFAVCQGMSGLFSADTAVDYPSFKTIGNLLGFFHARTRSPLSLLNFNKYKEYYSMQNSRQSFRTPSRLDGGGATAYRRPWHTAQRHSYMPPAID